MITRNVGTAERMVRLALAAILAVWILQSAEIGVAQGAAAIAALALLWNSIFGRCYLWKWLRLSSCPPEQGVCALNETQQRGMPGADTGKPGDHVKTGATTGQAEHTHHQHS